MKSIVGFQIMGVDEQNQHFDITEFLQTAINVSNETIDLEKENLKNAYCKNINDKIFLITRMRSMNKFRISVIRKYRRKLSKKIRQNIYYPKRKLLLHNNQIMITLKVQP